MKVLGIDPGLTRCGVSVLELEPGRKVKPVEVQVLRTDKSIDLPHRLLDLSNKLEIFFQKYSFTAVSIERVFYQNNVSTAMDTAQASGAAALLAARKDIPVFYYTPTAVKQTITGNGRADKQQVTFMVRKILGLNAEVKIPDAADACALAICHAWQHPTRNLINEAMRKNNLSRLGK